MQSQLLVVSRVQHSANMVHPLESKLDESFHRRPPARRRSSLDNSNLSAEGAVKERLASARDPLDDDDKKQNQQRRPSLSDGITIPITFLANANGVPRPKVDLDMDLHTSAHSRTKGTVGGGATLRRSLLNRPSSPDSTGSGSDNDDDIGCSILVAAVSPRKASATDDKEEVHDSGPDSDLSSHSSDDDDSFCDASVMEQANEEYIKDDLGASCFWSDGPDDLADVDFQIDDEELQRNLVEIIAEEGLEEGMEAADAAALAEALKGLTNS